MRRRGIGVAALAALAACKGKPSEPAARAAAATARPVAARSYVVRKGDTLASIARKTSCSSGAIANANALRAPRYALKVGQSLKLPACAR